MKITKTYNVDLHLHSTYSDGILSPKDLVNKVFKRGVEVASLTDHDTIDGLDEMIQAGTDNNIKIIPGIELSSYATHEIHILGYNMKYKSNSFIQALQRSKDCRRERNLELKKVLIEKGIDVSDQDFGEKNFGRVKIARIMIQKGYVDSVDEAFAKYLGKDGIAYVQGNRLTPADAVEVIASNGGIPVIAHPKKLYMEGELEDLIKQLVPLGLKGLECYYPGHSNCEVAIFTSLAEKYCLIATGGSDYHGPEEKDFQASIKDEVLWKLGLEQQ